MEQPITIDTSFDGHTYVVVPIKWVRKEEIRRANTVSDVRSGKFEFNDALFSLTIVKEATTKDGKPLTDADIADWDAHTGEVVVRAVNKLNSLSPEESRNLGLTPSWTRPKTP